MYDSDNDAERIFYQDSYEKKKNGRGVFSRASRRGFIKGGVRTQYDYLTSKERKMLNGEIKMSNLYENVDNIPTLEELLSKDEKTITFILTKLKELHSTILLREKFGISSGKLYSLFNKYNVPYTKRSSTNELVSLDSSSNSSSNSSNDTNVKVDTNSNLLNPVIDTAKLKSELKKYKNKFSDMSKDDKGILINKYRTLGLTNNEIGDAVGVKGATISVYYNKFYVKNKNLNPSYSESFNDLNKDVNKNIPGQTVMNVDGLINNSDSSCDTNVQAEIVDYDPKTNVILEKQLDEIARLKATIDSLNKQIDGLKNFNGINISLKGCYNGKKTKDKILSMIDILADDEFYDVYFNVKDSELVSVESNNNVCENTF